MTNTGWQLPARISENAELVVRPSRLVLLLAVASAAVVALSAPGAASARVTPLGAQFRVIIVNRMSDGTFAALARRGAVGVMRPGFGPTTSRRSAYDELVRGAEVNSYIGDTPPGRPLIGTEEQRGAWIERSCSMCIVLQLPPRNGTIANGTLYRVAVVGQGYHGLLVSPTTRIPGLVSIVDIAPTAIHRPSTGLSWVAASNAVGRLTSLSEEIHSNDRLKYAGLFVVVGFSILLALLGWTAARTAIPAALLANLCVGMLHITNEVAIVAVFTVTMVLGALWLARICRDDLSLLSLIAGVVLLYGLVYAARPEWAAVTPLGPDQNLRFWGIGDQIATLLFAPLLIGAVIARHRLGWLGFAAFSLLGFFVMTDNRLGANGGGAIGLGVALAVLGARLVRRGFVAFAAALTVTATVVFMIVRHGLGTPGPNHLRSAFGKGIQGFIDVAAHRVPLVYAPAIHDWPLTLPLALMLTVSVVLALRSSRARVTRDVLFALVAGLLASLLINDATGFMLAAGIACASAVVRFAPTGEPVRVPVLARLRPALERASTESRPR
jgi:hypothetical protein